MGIRIATVHVDANDHRTVPFARPSGLRSVQSHTRPDPAAASPRS
jgi:hypothetical protein